MSARILAAQGASNAEIFAELGFSSGELKRRLKVDHQLIFDIVEGRREFCEPHLTNLTEIALGHSDLPRSAYAAILAILQRADEQNKALCVGYDIALIEQIPGGDPSAPMDAAALTAALRVAK